MVRISDLNDALKNMFNAEKRGKRQALIRPSSKVVIKFLSVMQKHGYIGEFELVDDHRAGKIVVELNGRLNKCGVISPRYNVGVGELEAWTARLLPSRQFGYIVLTTSAGIMDHDDARRKNVGGKVLGFFYLENLVLTNPILLLVSCWFERGLQHPCLGQIAVNELAFESRKYKLNSSIFKEVGVFSWNSGTFLDVWSSLVSLRSTANSVK